MGIFVILGYNFSRIRPDMVGDYPIIKPFLAWSQTILSFHERNKYFKTIFAAIMKIINTNTEFIKETSDLKQDEKRNIPLYSHYLYNIDLP